ncbi:hypothetical protein BKA66DRAFT_450807 [Pyrenochaeta sp. MPI-SDFR-AT-0127]|nr:hypothetical protein BKA66DRAFT_450807 [Pyrenochaeta sp. MPI-SDFR-AT-0127]
MMESSILGGKDELASLNWLFWYLAMPKANHITIPLPGKEVVSCTPRRIRTADDSRDTNRTTGPLRSK